jgi:hypothetical protein
MFSSFQSFCNYIYEKFENLYSINKNILEHENNEYCRMQDGDFPINITKKENILERNNCIQKNIDKTNEKIKIRMESYRK